MIEIKFYYQSVSGKWKVSYKTFYKAVSALRFIYKCVRSPKLLYDGDIACDDPLDLEYINRRLK